MPRPAAKVVLGRPGPILEFRSTIRRLAYLLPKASPPTTPQKQGSAVIATEGRAMSEQVTKEIGTHSAVTMVPLLSYLVCFGGSWNDEGIGAEGFDHKNLR